MGAVQPALGEPDLTTTGGRLPLLPAPSDRRPEWCYTRQVFGLPQVPTVTIGTIPDDAYLLDVREGYEWGAGHAPTAHHVPMMDVPARIAELPGDGDVVVICRMGARSAQVVAYLQAQGRDRVHNLEGGMEAWEAAGRPMVSEDGSAARVV